MRGLRGRIREGSRNHKLDQFYAAFKEPCRVLDVGVLRLETNNKKQAANHFLKTFRFAPSFYTGLAIEDMSGMAEAYPRKRFVEYDGKFFPFSDKEFDAIFSNAVIEHVGDFNDQLLFLNEMLRVAHRVFFTTPNKWFPIETHTGAFLLHWNEGLFFKWCKSSGRYYTKQNLNLLGSSELTYLLGASAATEYEIIPNPLGGVAMTYSVFCSSK